MADVFISYARSDRDLAAKLRDELVRKNISVWVDSNDLMPGEMWEDKLQEALDSAGLFVFLMSSSSLSAPNLALELGYAIGRARETHAKLVPVLVSDAKLPSS